jgi:endonuclease I
MKLILIALFLLNSTLALANGARTYYDSIPNLSGYELKSALKKLLKKTHEDRGYKQLYRIYAKSDKDVTYDGDNSVVDIYSENPNGKDPYVYKSTQRCGTYRGEADCYNREHLFPQSSFDKKAPMRSDIFHVYASDGYVNNRRGHYSFGEVSDVEWKSQNGCKLGKSANPGPGDKVFEPINEFKGDIARAMLYFATRYEDKVARFHHEMLDGSKDKVYKTWFLELMLKWHRQDPVSAHEIRRNQVGFEFQGNRNPFIDHPEWVEKIWAVTK